MKNSIRAQYEISITGQVPRTAAVQKMKNISASKNLYISAPSGYGKTVAASQWLASVRGSKAKIIADESDNIPGFFYKRIAAALMKLTGRKNPVSDPAISFDRLLDIVKGLPSRGKRCYMLLDDIHMIHNTEVIKRMPLFFQRVPGYIRWCVINRSESAALVKTGAFDAITKEDLLFSAEEIEWLGVEKGIELTAGQAKALREKTGGWIMYLLALLSGGRVAGSIIDAKTPSSLMDYIETQVWQQIESEMKRTLLRLAVPEEVNPELCRRITGQKNGLKLLRHISMDDNTFLSEADKDKNIYRFHDIYREFLLGRIRQYLDEDEIRRINDIAGMWCYEQGYYYKGAEYYINNRDHEGIVRCLSESFHYLKETAHASVEVRLNFSKQYIYGLPEEFISENPYLMIRRTFAAFHDGDSKTFIRYLNALYPRLPEITSGHPELADTVFFAMSLDFRRPALEWCKAVQERAQNPAGAVAAESKSARVISITQNLPFIHRSMRDHSEFFELKEADIDLISSTYGRRIGKDFEVMRPLIVAGIHYERGEMVEAMLYVMQAHAACTDEMHPETRFCSYMLLAAIFFYMGAEKESREVMGRIEGYIEREARFLIPNFKAVKAMLAVHDGEKAAAREWLDVNAYKSPGQLPFYQLCRHYTTMQSLLLLGEYQQAANFGRRLQKLADDYMRPLDKIQSRLLLAAALGSLGEKGKAAKLLEQAVSTARPYGFVQLFVNERKRLLPMLREMIESRQPPGGAKRAGEVAEFVKVLIDAMHSRDGGKPGDAAVPALSVKQLSLLSYIGEGMTYGTIAEKTGIPLATVKYHILAAYRKLGVHDGFEALARAKELGLL